MICVLVCVRERDGAKKEGDGRNKYDDEGEELCWCSNGVPHIRQSPALLNVLQIAPLCAF